MRNLRVEIPRKLFHIFGTLLLLIPLYLFGKFSVFFLMLFILCILLPVSVFRVKNRWTSPFWRMVELLEREENLKTVPGKQAFSLSAGICLTALMFSQEALEVAIVTTAIYDGAATITGLLWGKHKMPNGKSVEGTVGGIILNSIALLFFIPAFESIAVSVFSATVENISSSKRWFTDDNFLIPVLTGGFYYLLQVPA